MYCQNCGNLVNGNFCNNCGSKLTKPNESNYNSQKKSDKPNFAPAITILILFWISSCGQYLSLLEDPLDNINWAYLYALIDVAIASVIMSICPFIYRIINKEQIEYYKCKKICIANSIILFIVSIFLTSIISIGFVGGLGALCYYFINMGLFSKKKPEKNSKNSDTFFINPKLTNAENQRIFFSEMPLEELKDLIENKKEEYTEEAYNIAFEQYKLRSTEISTTDEKGKIKKDIELLDSSIDSLNKMLNDAKRDLGNLTVDDIENMFRQKLISKQQKNDMINSIEILQTIINTTPHSIETTLKSKAELEEKINNLQNV